MDKLRIDPEFRDKIPAMTEEQFSGLREDILRDGYVRDPLVVWQEENTLLDGHHRWRVICENWETLSDKYTIDYKSFPNRWAALEWICRNQLNKHNLNDEQITYITGEMYKARKKSNGGDRRSKEFSVDQNDPLKDKPKSTAEAIARELGIAEPTVKRAEKFHDGIDAIREISKEAADKVMSGGSGATKKEVKAFPTKAPEEQSKFISDVLSGAKKAERSQSISCGRKKSTNPHGYTREDREERAKTNAIIADMYDASNVPEFTLDFLLEDIDANGMEYVSLLRNTLIDKSTLLTDENKPAVADAIDKIINEIKKVKELVEK